MIPRHTFRRLQAFPALAAATAVLVGSLATAASGGPDGTRAEECGSTRERDRVLTARR